MRPFFWMGLAGIAFVWGVLSWIKVHGFLDFASLVFISFMFILLSLFAVVVVRGDPSG